MANPDFDGRVALVTGASLGIGRATAIALGAAGADVVVNYRRHREAADEVAQVIRDRGGRAITHQADVADDRAIAEMVEQAVKAFGRLDVVVANAAFSERALLHEADMTTFRRTIDVTMWGSLHALYHGARQMISQGDGGAIVVVSSPHAFLSIPRSMAYNMAKAAIEQMAKTAALELAPHRIRVNIIQPGWTDTPGERAYADEETLREAAQSLPYQRLATAEEIADGILVLCDPRHAYMTGATLLIDGGFSLPWWADRDAFGQRQSNS